MAVIPEAIWAKFKAFLNEGHTGTVIFEIGLPGRVTGAQFNGEVQMPNDEKLNRMVRGMVMEVLRDAGVPVQPKPKAAAPGPAPPAAPATK